MMKMLDNARARVTEVIYEPGVRRESYLRPTDQIVVFLNDCRFDRIDSKTGQVLHRSRKAGEVLWHAKINPTSMPIQPKTLTIIVGEFTVDGSTKPNSIIEATVKPGDRPVRDIWPDGQERDMTFIYSACGCPVKVLARRKGDVTVRTKELPVIFPDDPDAVRLIERLMGWKTPAVAR